MNVKYFQNVSKLVKNYEKEHGNVNDTSTIDIFQIVIQNQTDASRRSSKIFKKVFKKIFSKVIISTSEINSTILNVQISMTSPETPRQYSQIVILMSRRLKVPKSTIKAAISEIAETISSVITKTTSKVVEITSKIPGTVVVLRRSRIVDN